MIILNVFCADVSGTTFLRGAYSADAIVGIEEVINGVNPDVNPDVNTLVLFENRSIGVRETFSDVLDMLENGGY